MNDRELLELAAKAAGYDTSHPWNAERLTLNPPVPALCIPGVSTGWDPLDDDGDALRLAVKLNIGIDFINELDVATSSVTSSGSLAFVVEPIGSDKYNAVRLAIVRLAGRLI